MYFRYTELTMSTYDENTFLMSAVFIEPQYSAIRAPMNEKTISAAS